MESTPITTSFQIIQLDNETTCDQNDRKIDFNNLIEHLKVYNEPSQCQQYIASLDNADKIFLIVPGSIGEKILQSIHEQIQIVCIYIFCIDIQKHQLWTNKFNKIRGLFNQSNTMLNRLQRDVQLLIHHFTPVNVFTMQDVKQTTLQNIDKEQSTYMWFQLLIETLLKLPQTSQARSELINECMQHYRNDNVEKQKIETFAIEYTHENVIEWYTRDCFLYRLVNRAFRTRNIDTIFKYRYFIVDLHQRLLELHENQYSIGALTKLTVYRGQLMSIDELNKLKTNINGIFSINTFLSTTTNSNIALEFIKNAFERPFLEKILYEINIDATSKYKWPFADIHDDSCNTQENEILFDIGSTFRIDEVYQYTTDLWYVSLTLLDINDPSTKIDTKLHDYLIEHSFKQKEPTLLILCFFLEEMGQFELSRQFCELMLRDISEGEYFIAIQSHLALIEYDLGNFHTAKTICEKALAMQTVEDLCQGETTILLTKSNLHSHMGHILSELGDYKKAIFHYHQAVLIDEVLLPEDDDDRAIGFNNLGTAYSDSGDFKKALYWLEERALKLQLSKLPSKHPDLATTYSNIGETYSENGKYEKAREMYEHVLAIENEALPPLHPSTHSTFNNLAVVNEKLGNYDTALMYHRKSLEVLFHSYSLNHISFATTYNNMAAVFDLRGEFDEALSYYDKALRCLLTNVGTENHPDVASTYNNIGMTYYQRKDYDKALEYFEKTQTMEKQLLGSNHSSLATTYNNLGMVFAAQQKLKSAMEFHQRALTIRRRVLSKMHPELAASYDNLGVVYCKRGFYKTAIDYHQRALHIQKKSLPHNHPSIATTKEHLGDIYCRLRNYRAAFKYYTDALNIAKACLPLSHPSIERCSTKIQQCCHPFGLKIDKPS